jgi:hypothetical protein
MHGGSGSDERNRAAGPYSQVFKMPDGTMSGQIEPSNVGIMAAWGPCRHLR